MELLFLSCAILGGTVMVAQFILTLMGGGEHGGGDGGGHDFHTDVGGGDHAVGDAHDGQHGSAAHDQDQHHGSTWFFGVITFRTVVAALTFFGLAGMAAMSAQLEQPMPLVIALGSGVAAMYGVHLMMQALNKLRADGTERIGHALGREATVYLSIPAQSQGAGKVHLTMQNRLIEYEAMTSGERVPTGTRVVVVGIAGPGMLQVEPVSEIARKT